ncbi:MAG: hypothetical protein NVV60_05765 [Luteimonas sp.]|nr:hypothetical protein [Luteimonas sp.]
MSRENEAYMPPDLIRRVLEGASTGEVLIGGQALAYWMGVYNVRLPIGSGSAVSRDVDFFTRNAANITPLKQFALAIGGREEVNDIRNISALIGSAIAPAEDGRIYNVDLLHDVVGLDRDRLEANAFTVQLPGTDTEIRVMHPLDLLQSRNANLHLLTEKQDHAGQLQFRLAIEVARAFLEEQIDQITEDAELTVQQRQRAVFDAVSIVNDYSTEDAAKKNAERYGIFLADAIPAWRIESDVFWEKQWPHLRERMSQDYANECEEWVGRNLSSGS